MKRDNMFLGALLIVVGLLFLLARVVFDYKIISFDSGDFWPIIVLAIGVTFELIFFRTGKASGFLVPGGILTTIGVLFFFEVATKWSFSAYTWPVYILAVAIGLFQLYLFGGKQRGLLIPVFILTSVAAIAVICIIFEVFLSAVDLGFIIPIILIAGGLLFIFRRKTDR